MEDSSRLRQIIFKLDKSKMYKFNTNATVTIKSLRKIIIAAANLSNKNLQMINRDKDFIEFENFTIQQLFPEENTIEFTIKILPDLEIPVPIKIKQGGVNCVNHKYKFPYFYCYDCKYSICSLCVQSKEHLNHKLLDKHDYVQNTDVIVDTLFSDFKGLLSELSIDKEAEIQNYKDKIDKEIFPYLFQHLNSVKNKVFKVMNIFIENINKNKKILYENVEILRNLSYDGIEDLKKKLKIEDIMVDEEIFLAFDEKMKEISNEKIRILKDSKKYEELLKVISFLSTNVDNIYEEILEIIDKKLKNNIQEKLSEKILENFITSITRDEIDNILFSDLKKPRKPKIDHFQPKKSDFLSGLFSNKNNGVSGNLTNFFSTISKENVKPQIDLSNSMTSPIKEPYNKILNPEESIFYCKPNSQSLVIYDDKEEKIFVQDINVKDIAGFKQFLPGNTWINSMGLMYISGGFINEIEMTNSAYLYDGRSNRLIAIPSMIYKRANHSLVQYKDIIYASGGKGITSIEFFDTKKYKWTMLGEMTIEREFPISFVHDNYLYNFFGLKNNAGTDTVERIRINGKENSQLVNYRKEANFDLKIYGAGVIEMNQDSILILGGKYKNSFNRNYIFQFDFSEEIFNSFEFDIESDVVFVESGLHKLKDGNYSNFNKADNNLFKIVIDNDQ